ncbi:hypothetical protein [Euzebya sp.]|uniref:hypothetical protein n=1 Tax=Euzebya sp. TaxID=1971409 RepID=UPI003512DE82
MRAPEALITWLLDGDPAVQWQVRRDLLDAPADVVAVERARVATEGWGAALLAAQHRDGGWGEGLYSPKWTSTTYTLLLLCQLGLPAGDDRARQGCGRLLDGARWIDGGGLNLAKTVRYPEVCMTALVLRTTADCGVQDERLGPLRTWLLDQQLGDGGWNCETIRTHSTHGSFDTSILVLEALHAWESARGPDPEVARAAERGREFFAAHRLYCSHRTGEVVDPAYERIVFPPGWHHDLLRGLEHFASAGAPVDDRLADAVALLRSRRRPDGTWAMNARHPGRYHFVLEPPRVPSRLTTVRALRVLRWWEEGQG